MNTDDFEKQLQQPPLQTPPAAWRGEILAAARAELRPETRRATTELLAGWRAVWARIPVAWAAVAAVWVFIFGVNLAISGPDFFVASGDPRPARDALAIWSLHNAEMSLLADQFAEPPPPPAPPAAPAPRSDRHREEGWGELERKHTMTRAV